MKTVYELWEKWREAAYVRDRYAYDDEPEYKKWHFTGARWYEYIVEPIARDLEQLTGLVADGEVGPPMGLCCRVWISLWDPAALSMKYEDRIKNDPRHLVIPVEPHDLHEGSGILMIRDYDHRIGYYFPGTIGEMNGMNYDVVYVPDNATAEWFLEWAMEDL